MSAAPYPYSSPQMPGLHSGVVEVAATGSTLIDLGIGHANFIVTLGLKQLVAAHTEYVGVDVAATPTDITVGDVVSWSYGPVSGTFYIHATVAAATEVSFIALEGAAV